MPVNFDSIANVVEENDVEPKKPHNVDEKLLGSSYFSSLASKEAADKLAQLQQVGKVNSKLRTMSDKDPMEIIAEELRVKKVVKKKTKRTVLCIF
nr:unnamed protein product [Callosobruchus analis]